MTSSRLEPALKTALKDMKDGEVSAPIRVTGGFKVIKLLARRFAGEADPLETEVTLIQVGFEIPQNMSEEEAGRLKAQMN
ncbi:peptidylprolyl isomerase, partial [Acinetobacter baumannii]